MLINKCFADENDFDTSLRHVTFPADEGMNPVHDLFIPIRVVNDAVNEADQTFIVQLRSVSTFERLKIGRSHSYCIILDDDREYHFTDFLLVT